MSRLGPNLWASAINLRDIRHPAAKDNNVEIKDIDNIPKILSKNKTSLMTLHLFSSCPMGENKNLCPVNSFGELVGYKNIFVNDGSLLPTAPGVNPQGTIMAIARRNIHNFLNNI